MKSNDFVLESPKEGVWASQDKATENELEYRHWTGRRSSWTMPFLLWSEWSDTLALFLVCCGELYFFYVSSASYIKTIKLISYN